MSRRVELADVPEAVLRNWEADAKRLGVSLDEYLLRKLGGSTRKSTKEEILARLQKLEPVEVSEEPAEIIRRAREGER